eukprot:TRINITY_DN112926_c0_g1_i1.p1 TRINITY_DN112926_c0_g1~~TRINITY_DN112926_c0_g1_i1.p1  ORF type:complete len:289 (-),score=27.81 TRINITY_DN112926_c0_g1_i1:437-1303(-)
MWNRKILFLDVDGVLAPYPVTREWRGIDTNCIRLLGQIVQATGCQLVMSSSWRTMPGGYQHINQQLQQNGVPPCIDQTPVIGNGGPANRATEINQWLSTSGRGVSSWVVVDDDPIPINNMVKTNPQIGITQETVQQAINVLNSGGGGGMGHAQQPMGNTMMGSYGPQNPSATYMRPTQNFAPTITQSQAWGHNQRWSSPQPHQQQSWGGYGYGNGGYGGYGGWRNSPNAFTNQWNNAWNQGWSTATPNGYNAQAPTYTRGGGTPASWGAWNMWNHPVGNQFNSRAFSV